MLNVAIIMGRLTADPELRHTPSDIAVTTFTLAVDRGYTKAGAEKQTDFIDIVAWRNTAEFACKYFQKGRMMAVHGSIQTRSYTDKEGSKRKAFEIVATDINFADSKRATAETESPSKGIPQKPPATAAAPAYSLEAPNDYNNISFGDFEAPEGPNDDLPF